jgi:hypothetical protein
MSDAFRFVCHCGDHVLNNNVSIGLIDDSLLSNHLLEIA